MTVLIVADNADITWKRNLNIPNVIQLFIALVGLLFMRIHTMQFQPIRIRIPKNQIKVLSFFFEKYLPQVHFQTEADGHAVPIPFASVLFPEQNVGGFNHQQACGISPVF